MKLANSIGAVVLSVALNVCAPAGAASWDAVSDFSVASNPNGTWAYGEGVAGQTFAPFVNSFTNGGFGPTVEYWQSSNPIGSVPLVALDTAAGPSHIWGGGAGSAYFATDALLVHPGKSSDVIVQWTAPVAGDYHYSGKFEILDMYPSGVIVDIFANNQSIYSRYLQGQPASIATFTPGATRKFSGQIDLAAGDILSFAVNNAGSFYDDSTGFTATISSVPEPASWAMMILGIGAIGVGLRSRPRVARG